MEKIKTVQLYATKDYSKFKLLKGLNRSIKKGHLKRLVESISKKNLLKDFPIIVDKDFYVLDGQHRLKAAEVLGLKVYFFITSDMTVDDIPIINCLNLKWTPLEFMERQIAKGNVNYLKFKQYLNNYQLNISAAKSIFLNLACGSSFNFNKGDFIYPEDASYAHSMMKKILDFLTVQNII